MELSHETIKQLAINCNCYGLYNKFINQLVGKYEPAENRIDEYLLTPKGKEQQIKRFKEALRLMYDKLDELSNEYKGVIRAHKKGMVGYYLKSKDMLKGYKPVIFYEGKQGSDDSYYTDFEM